MPVVNLKARVRVRVAHCSWQVRRARWMAAHHVGTELTSLLVLCRIVKDERFERLPCLHPGTYADDCLVQRVTQVTYLIHCIIIIIIIISTIWTLNSFNLLFGCVCQPLINEYVMLCYVFTVAVSVIRYAAVT